VRIVDPTYGLPEDVEVVSVSRDRIPQDALCLFSNSKPGADELLKGIGRRLTAERGIDGIGFAAKPAASVPAASETIDHLAEQYRMAVVAIGD
jgi:hypothetical protein